jgi:hypothetical protein
VTFKFTNGTKIWCLLSRRCDHGEILNLTAYESKDDALNHMRRGDRLISYVVSELKEEPECVNIGVPVSYASTAWRNVEPPPCEGTQ